MTWLNYEAPRFPPREIEQKISSLYEDQAEAIIDKTVQSQLCVVEGPWASGKTRYLIPLVAQKIIARGINVFTADGQIHQSEDYFNKRLPETDRGILILDEAGAISHWHHEEGVRTRLNIIHEKGWKIIAIIAYHPQHPDITAISSKLWQSVEESHGGKTQIVSLPEFRLPRDLAEEFVRLRCETDYNNPVNPETLKYLLDNIPFNLRLLNFLSLTVSEPLPDFIEDLLVSLIPKINSSLNKKDAEKLIEKFYQDYETIKKNK